MNKENFIATIEHFQRICDANNKEIQTTKNIFSVEWICDLTSRHHDLVISLIEQLFDFKDEWIYWFCFENDFGRKGYLCRGKDGIDVSIKNAKDLWDFVKD